MWDLKIKPATVYLSMAWTCTPKWGHSFRGEVSWRSPWRPYTNNRIHTGHLHSSPSLIYTLTHRQTHTNRFWKGWHVCLGKGVLNVKFAYAVTPFLSSNMGMLAPELLHLYSEEVGSEFCCLILQLIANRMSIALQHTATCRQPEHPMQLCKHKRHSLFKWYVHRTKRSWWEMIKVLIFCKVRTDYFTYSAHDRKTLTLYIIFSRSLHL